MMKHLLLASFAVLPVIAQADTFDIPMIPSQATVYPQGAHVMSRSVLDLPTGNHTVNFLLPAAPGRNLPPQVAVAGGQVTGTSIVRSNNKDARDFLTEDQQGIFDEHLNLKDDVSDAQRSVDLLISEQGALKSQAIYLESIRPATDAPQSLEDITAIAGYLPSALAENAAAQAEIATRIQNARMELDDLRTELARSEIRLQGLGLPSETWTGVSLNITVDTSSTVEIATLTFSDAANWRPKYDVRLDENSGTITLDRTAMLSQATGQGWDDVLVTLSSARPFQQIDANPAIRDVVRIFNANKRGVSISDFAEMSEPEMSPQILLSADVSPARSAPASGSFDGVAVTFELNTALDLPTGWNSGQLVPLAPVTLQADVDRYANARRDTNAFVRAQFENETGEPILSGDATYFRDGVLIGHKDLNLIAAGAEKTFFFGPDETLPIDLNFLSEMSGDQGFLTRSNTREETIAFDIKNLGSQSQSVVLSYATPTSVDEDLRASVQTVPRADRTDVGDEPGVMEWDFTLSPGAQQQVTLDFKITWPEGSSIDWRP